MVTQPVKTLIAGNWKMNGLAASLDQVEAVANAIAEEGADRCNVALCLPAPLIAPAAAKTASSALTLGGQDCHAAQSGAHTGDTSAEMLADAGATYVIVGHSERRADHGETDGDISAKVEGAFRAGLTPIICVGETETERRAGHAIEVVEGQLAASIPGDATGRAFVVAYEPVWAIGTGLTPTNDDIAEMHTTIRRRLVERFGDHGAATPILYGGSMKPANAAEIMGVDEVNGGLVGGASLKAEDFLAIVRAA